MLSVPVRRPHCVGTDGNLESWVAINLSGSIEESRNDSERVRRLTRAVAGGEVLSVPWGTGVVGIVQTPA